MLCQTSFILLCSCLAPGPAPGTAIHDSQVLAPLPHQGSSELRLPSSTEGRGIFWAIRAVEPMPLQIHTTGPTLLTLEWDQLAGSQT